MESINFIKAINGYLQKRDTTMVLTTEFYDYLHELEKDGSINRFDMDSPELTKLHELASGTFEDRRANCIKLLERGFDKWEIAAETEFAASVIENFRREARIPIVPHYNYLIDGKFYTDLNALRKAFKIPTTAGAIDYLCDRRHKAYHLKRFHWEQIPLGSHLIDGHGTERIKNSPDIRTYKQF
jgi:hypothetical protein